MKFLDFEIRRVSSKKRTPQAVRKETTQKIIDNLPSKKGPLCDETGYEIDEEGTNDHALQLMFAYNSGFNNCLTAVHKSIQNIR